MADEECRSTLDLMQPEVLSVEVLRQVLSQRLVSTELAGAPKPALVELWHRLVTPLPQRTYGGTNTGRWYAARQRRPRPGPAGDSAWKSASLSLSDGRSNASAAAARVAAPSVATAAPPGGDRLKPPPAALTGEKRIIKLNGKRSAEGSLDGIVIRRRTETREATPDEGARSRVTPPAGGAAPAGVTVGAVGATAETQPANNGKQEPVDCSLDIKAKLQVEKRKIKIRRKVSGPEPEAKRTAGDR
ncbi:uncharacterized protein LOC119101341 [Pollicipes pollicipes]|uniref:uncharacterized protein LOC119101341 n=1 Tax=Pollicipes pollicipes TaxID=41117 RepID=UPI001884969A|nr:uncharacterized protein LOC119101341 [Pollicipes pollicipes]XP_037080552.1 uncharacterized protein LOC119101341 [Pollicipes pollicipes]XP_037080553.1 uncharacterized protein LOC119101341 [Pollicipes pollicipes]